MSCRLLVNRYFLILFENSKRIFCFLSERITLIFLIFLFLFSSSYSQNLTDTLLLEQATNPKSETKNQKLFYDTDLLSKEFHKSRRTAFRDSLPQNSVAAIFPNPIRNRANDVDFEFHQDPNFFYLTGLHEPNSLLLIFKDTQQVDSILFNEIIFVQQREPHYEIWNGKRLGVDGVKEILGFETVYLNSDFADFPLDFLKFENILSVLPKEELRDDKNERGDLYSLVKHFKLKTDSIHSKTDRRKINEILSGLREIKQPEELELMRKAITITCEAQKELMKALLPGMKEYQAEAIVEYVFKKNGAEEPGYPSILGGGENSCILHYTTNRKTLSWDDLLVSDVGAEYHGYSADVTRTLPADGEFSPQEKAIYELVLEAQLAGIKVCRKGNKFWDPNIEAKKIIQKGLQNLGIIQEANEANIYFMHGTSHYLGLDVHDAGLYGNFKPGNVITVEPGIYIPANSKCDPKWWNIGVRIEDDVLITEDDPEILSSCVPKTIKEIEELMKQESLFNQIGSEKK